MKYAYQEWDYQRQPGSESQMTGVLQCFCKEAGKIYGLGSRSMKFTYDFALPEEAICKEYVDDSFLGLFYNQVSSQSIIVINYILRLFIIQLIIYIGKDTESEQTKLITNGVFIV